MALVAPVAPLYRLLTGVAASAVVAAVLSDSGKLVAVTGLAGGFFAVLLVQLWELAFVASDYLRSAMTRGARQPAPRNTF